MGRTKILRNGTVVRPDGLLENDVVIHDGRVHELVPRGRARRAEVQLDLRGMLLFPGFVDGHVHSRDPGLTHKEDLEHSTAAAAAGGTTTILEMPNAVPPVLDAVTLRRRLDDFAGKAHVDFGLWGLSLGRANLDELASLFELGAVGVKMFLGYSFDRATMQLRYGPSSDGDEIEPPDTGAILAVAREVARVGGLFALHCEDAGILAEASRRLAPAAMTPLNVTRARPVVAETVAVAIVTEIAAATGCRIQVLHVSSRRAVEIIRGAQASGIPVAAETCPHYLTLTDEAPVITGGGLKVFPPVRPRDHQEALWQAVIDRTITSISSDHAPHSPEERSRAFEDRPAGAVGVETRGPLMIDAMCAGQIDAQTLCWALAEGPARLYGLHPTKGRIAPGADADICVVDPTGGHVLDASALHTLHPYSPWDGMALRGMIQLVLLRGEVVAERGRPSSQRIGRFLPARRSGARKPR